MAASVGDFLNFLSPFEYSHVAFVMQGIHVEMLPCYFVPLILSCLWYWSTHSFFFFYWCWSQIFCFFLYFCSPICWLLTVLLWVIYVINFNACNANKRNLFLYIIKVVTTTTKKKKYREVRKGKRIHCKSLEVNHK